MNYYKIKRTDAEGLGLNLLGHLVTTTLVIVSDMDLRTKLGFDKSPEELQSQLNAEPITERQIAQVKADSRWFLYKG